MTRLLPFFLLLKYMVLVKQEREEGTVGISRVLVVYHIDSHSTPVYALWSNALYPVASTVR